MNITIIGRAALWCGAAAAAIALPLIASAQEMGTLLTHRPASVNGTTKIDARRTMREFGTCSVARAPGSAERFVGLPVDSPDAARFLPSVASPDCLGDGELHIPRPIIRGSLFEALYVRRFHRSGPVTFAGAAPIDYAAGYSPPYSPAAANAIGMGQLGDCVVRADGEDAKTLILAIPATAEEDGAIAGLTAHLGPCVVKGQRITFSRSIIRAAIAEGLYRLSLQTTPAG